MVKTYKKGKNTMKTIDKQVTAFVAAVCNCLPAELTAERMQEWVEKPLELQGFLKGLVNVRVGSHIIGVFKAVVDKTTKIEKAVEIYNDIDSLDECINSTNFPVPEGGDVSEKEILVFHFKKGMRSEEIIAKMAEEGCRPADIWELIALAKEKPKLPRKYLIIALGSICMYGAIRRVPSLSGNIDYRYRRLNLYRFDGGWGDGCYFAAVHK
jgi:hypothetical protein